MAILEVARPFSASAARVLEVSRPSSAAASRRSDIPRPFSASASRVLDAANSNSLSAARRLGVDAPHSLSACRVQDLARPHSLSTSTSLDVARPFSVEAGRVVDLAAPSTARVAQEIPPAVAAGLEAVDNRVYLFLPDGSAVPISTYSVHTEINQGWTCSCQLPYWLALDVFEDVDENDEWFIVVQDGLGNPPLQTPPLTLKPRTLGADESGDSCALNFTDQASHRASKKGISLGTFRNTTTGSILGAVSSAAGVSLPGPAYGVIEEDVQQSSAVDAWTRILSAMAWDFWVDAQGRFRSGPFEAVGERYRVRPSSIQRNGDPTQRITSLLFVKTTSIQTEKDYPFYTSGFKSFALPNPLNAVNVQDISALGSIDEIGLWNGDPQNGGKLIRIQSHLIHFGILTVPLDGQDPTTHISCNVYPGSIQTPDGSLLATLRVRGTSPERIPAGCDLAFSYQWTGGPGGVDGGVWAEQLFPSQATIAGRAAALARQKCRGVDRLSIEGPQDTSPELKDVVYAWTQTGDTLRTWPDAKIESITHQGSDGAAPTTKIEAMVL